MKIWVDDKRPAPDNSWITVTNYVDIISLLDNVPGYEINILHLDHDLGGKCTGYDVVRWIESQVFMNSDYIPPDDILCHSDNPVGKKNIMACVEKIYEEYKKR